MIFIVEEFFCFIRFFVAQVFPSILHMRKKQQQQQQQQQQKQHRQEQFIAQS